MTSQAGPGAKQNDFMQLNVPSEGVELRKLSGALKMMMNQKKELPELSGWLHKKSPALFAGWQKRYVTIKNKKLKYFKTSESRIPSGVLNFDIFKVHVMPGKNSEFSLYLEGQTRQFEFKADSEQAKAEWLRAIVEHQQASSGY